MFAPGHLGELTRVVPPEMVDAALETAGGIQRRLRRLPSRVVVYLLLAGGLFAGQGWSQVWDRLTAGLPIALTRPSKSAITEAMRRVGPGPLRELFSFFARAPLTTATGRVTYAGRLVVGIDGTQIPIADTEANRVRFPKPRSGPNGEAGYPMVRLLALVTCGIRSVLDVVFGTDQVGELSYARNLVSALRSGMVLLGDRNFATYQFFTDVAGTGADFLIRAKTGHGAMNLPVEQQLADGSWLSTARGLRVRVIDAEITITTQAGVRTGSYRLITTLTDPLEAPAKQLVELYHQRWEIETSFCELKSTILGGRVLRARHPSGVEQELWALLTAYQILRTAITDALLDQPSIDPGRASFTVAVNTAKDQVIAAGHLIEETQIDLVGRIGRAVLASLLPRQRIRTRQRVIKRAISKYRAKCRNPDRRTYPATLRTQILTTGPEP